MSSDTWQAYLAQNFKNLKPKQPQSQTHALLNNQISEPLNNFPYLIGTTKIIMSSDTWQAYLAQNFKILKPKPTLTQKNHPHIRISMQLSYSD